MSDDGQTRITLRIPDDLHKRLADRASRTSKSMNAEIIERLESSFAAYKRDAFHALKLVIARIDKVSASIEKMQGDLDRFESGDDSSLKWLADPAHERTRENVIESAQSILSLLENELTGLRKFVPILMDAVKTGASVPGEVIDFLAES